MSPDHKLGEDTGAGRTASTSRLAPLLVASLLVSLAGCLAACHTGAARTASAARAPGAAGGAAGAAGAARAPAAAAAAQPADDASYDWHGLLVAPLGSALKEVPLKLHEVLLFRDAASGAGAAPADDAECYAADSPAPRFLGHVPDQYLLCFRQDRLSRVQASVGLPAAEAPGVFAAACSRWSKTAAPAAAESGAAACTGHEGATHFSGRLEDEAVSITIDGVLSP